MNVTEDSDCDESGAMLLSQLQQCSATTTNATTNVADDADDADKVTQEFLAALETEFSSTSTHCSIVSVKKASSAGAMTLTD